MFAFWGLVIAVNYPVEVNEYFETFLSRLEGVTEMGLGAIFVFIFLNNSFVAFLASIGGIVLSVFPFIILVSNGLMLGVVLHIVLTVESFGFFLVGILPHGVIEIPVVLYATSLGIWLGKSFFDFLVFKKETKESMQDKLKRSFCSYIFIVVPLLFLAALIEVTVTPILLYLIS